MKLGLSSAEDSEHNFTRLVKAAIEARRRAASKSRSSRADNWAPSPPPSRACRSAASRDSSRRPTSTRASIRAWAFSASRSCSRTGSTPIASSRIRPCTPRSPTLLDAKGIVGCGVLSTSDVRYMTHQPDPQARRLQRKEVAHQRYGRRARTLPQARRDLRRDESRRHADCAAEQDHRRLRQRHDHLRQFQPGDRVEGAAADRGRADQLVLRHEQEVARRPAGRPA